MGDISRRTFVKMLGAAGAALVLPIDATAKAAVGDLPAHGSHAHPFQEGHEYGTQLGVLSYSQGAVKYATKCLLQDAQKILPRGSRIEIRAVIPTDYRRGMSVVWYHSPFFKKQPWNCFINWQKDKWERKGGYMLVGRGVI